MTIDAFKEERHESILAMLARHGRIRVAEMAARLNVSEATVRRDLAAMRKQGLLLRTHGGAMPAPPTAFEVPFDERQEQALTEKRAIGALAATLVHEGDSIIIESGSTPLELARRLVEVPRLRVLTNSLAIALELAANPETEIDVLGGSLRRRSASLVGPWVADALCTVRVDIAFLGANGISVEFGLSSPNVFTAESRKAMIASARRRVVLADHTKLGVDTFHHVAGLDAVDVLVTDAGAEDAQVAPIRAAGVEVLVAK